VSMRQITSSLILLFAVTFASPSAAQLPRMLSNQILREIEPDLIGRPERLPQYMQRFARAVVREPRLFAFEADANWSEDHGLQLTGHYEFAEHHRALLELLNVLGFAEVKDDMESLPTNALGAQKFGILKTWHSYSYDSPESDHEVVTDCLLGEPLYLLRQAESGFYLCHSGEGYLGYVDGRDILRVDEIQLSNYQRGRQVLLREDHATPGMKLPSGARLKWAGQTEDMYRVLLPGGRAVTLPISKGAVLEDDCDPAVECVIEHARRLLGTPYVWGGKTSAGVDCSGLVQTAFAAAGIHLPRDADQQALLGRLTATRWSRSGLRRGDTLFSLRADGRVGHTAIYLGEDQYLEAVRPVVCITSFDPQHPDYSARRDASFAFARRILEQPRQMICVPRSVAESD
jgi:hypothetical protein